VATLLLTQLRSPYGIVQQRGKQIVGFREKPLLPHWLSAGAYVLSREFFAGLPDVGDHEDELFPRLAERRTQAAGTMSGGEQQMVAVARALMSRPRLLLVDEPSLGLAPVLVQALFAALREINRAGVTILLVEQNVRQTLQMAHRGYVLENGRIALAGSGRDLLSNAHVKVAYLGL